MKYISGFILLLLLFIVLPTSAHAVALCPPDGGFAKLCNLSANEDGLGKLVGTAVQAAFVVAVVIALFYLIWGGIKWILSGGDKGGVEAARATIIAAVIGLVVTFAAYFILSFVLSLFGLSLDQVKLPKFT